MAVDIAVLLAKSPHFDHLSHYFDAIVACDRLKIKPDFSGSVCRVLPIDKKCGFCELKEIDSAASTRLVEFIRASAMYTIAIRYLETRGKSHIPVDLDAEVTRHIKRRYGGGCLVREGKFAELIEFPESIDASKLITSEK